MFLFVHEQFHDHDFLSEEVVLTHEHDELVKSLAQEATVALPDVFVVVVVSIEFATQQ